MDNARGLWIMDLRSFGGGFLGPVMKGWPR
jgi:hypothetical protein